MIYLIVVIALAFAAIAIFKMVQARAEKQKLEHKNYVLEMSNNRLRWELEMQAQELKLTCLEYGIKHFRYTQKHRSTRHAHTA